MTFEITARGEVIACAAPLEASNPEGHNQYSENAAKYRKQIERTGVIRHGDDDDESTRVIESDSQEGKHDVWHTDKSGNRQIVSDPFKPMPIKEAQDYAVNHALGNTPQKTSAAEQTETNPLEQPKHGMTMDEMKQHLANRAKEGVFGKTWAEIERMQGGKMRP